MFIPPPLYHISLEFYLIIIHEETEPPAGPSGRPLLRLARQLEAIQNRIKVETEDSPGDSDEILPIYQAPFLKVAPRQLSEAIQIKLPEAEGETEDSPRGLDEIPPIYQAPFLKVASRKLEAIQNRIKVLEAEVEIEDSPSDSDEIPPIWARAPAHQSRAARRRMMVGLGDNSQSKTLRPEYISERKGERGKTEDTLPEPENDRSVADDRTRTEKETTDEFLYFLYHLAFCAFLIFLFLLFVISLSCLYVLYK